MSQFFFFYFLSNQKIFHLFFLFYFLPFSLLGLKNLLLFPLTLRFGSLPVWVCGLPNKRLYILFSRSLCVRQQHTAHTKNKRQRQRETMSSPSKRRDMDLMKLSVIFSELFLYFRFHKVFFCINLLSFFHLGCVGLTWIRSSSGWWVITRWRRSTMACKSSLWNSTDPKTVNLHLFVNLFFVFNSWLRDWCCSIWCDF